MATHFVYEDAPNKTILCQGDVVERTPELLAVLAEFHPHYAQHADYKYFMVLTQTCDLVRREGGAPKSPYVALAAVRPVEQILRREAERYQDEWQVATRVIGSGRAKSALSMYLQRLFDNNEPGLFYLHEDRSLGIHQSCCAVLALSVALRAEHYDMLLGAKLAQLKEPFQAKLGSLIGTMYSRVATTEWDSEQVERTCNQQAEKVLNDVFVLIADEQIKEGIADLKDQGTLNQKKPDEILAFIEATKVRSRSTKLQERAVEVVRENKHLRPINQVRGRVITAIRSDDALKESIVRLLGEEGNPAAKAEQLIRLFDQKLGSVLTDDLLPERDKLLQGFIRGVLQDAKIAKILQ